MSLASLLLGKAASAPDADLDAVFARTKVEKPVVAPVTAAKVSFEAHGGKISDGGHYDSGCQRVMAGR